MRISIRKHHEVFLQNLAEQMGTDATSALDFLIFEAKKAGYSFTSALAFSPPVPTAPVMISAPMAPPTLGFVGATTAFDEIKPEIQTIDPIIARMAQLVEEF